MKTTLCVLALLFAAGITAATEQVPDILYLDGLRLRLTTGWGHPSPLETYYYEGRLAYPFEGFSTANYRGHVATWKVVEGKLYLSEVQTERYEPNAVDPNLWDFVVETYEPHECGVKSRSAPPSEDGDVLADWFKGVLDCYLVSEGTYFSYFYYVWAGHIIDSQVISERDYEVLYSTRLSRSQLEVRWPLRGEFYALLTFLAIPCCSS